MDQFPDRGKADPLRAEAFPPVPAVGAQDRFDVVLIDIRAFRNSIPGILSLIIEQNNLLLVSCRNPGVRNHQGQVQGVGAPALGTDHPLDP